MRFEGGHNCWKVAAADGVAFLVDGEAYFAALADACELAETAIYIIGWDIDSRIRLRREGGSSDETLRRFVNRLAREKPHLQVYILEWDFAVLYSLERETWPLLSFDWLTHERVHFELDDEHPVGASHHQKIVVIDDQVAFVGGFDLASCRWDTSEHAPDHPERCDDGTRYGPFHDVQMMVSGEAAAALGDLSRQRWERLTGERLPAPESVDRLPWPKSCSPDLEETQVAVLRTHPRYEGEPEVREIATFYEQAIAAATDTIYIENQYLTSHRIGKALEEALRKEAGPEILLVLPHRCSGWLEQETMGALRQRLVARLRAADSYGRLKICYPVREDLDEAIINVHSKVLIVDEQLLTIGSANLSNRSMGFDSECNLAIAADSQQPVAEAIAGLRNRLLAEHLGSDAETVAESLQDTGSLLKTVEDLNNDRRGLKELDLSEAHELIDTLSADELVDPEQPIDFDALLEYLEVGSAEEDEVTVTRRKTWRFATVLAMALLLAVLWRWSPLHQWLNLDALLSVAETIRGSAFAIPIVLSIYLVGSCLMFPVTLLILATALSFGPVMGFSLAFSGSLLGGLASYLMGRWLGRDVVRRLAGDRLNRLSRRLARRGWLAIAVIRVVPVAPYTIVNMVAGSTHISTRSFLIGTAVGMGPGILAIMLFEGGLENALRNPDPWSIALAVLAFGCAGLVLFWGKRWLVNKEERDES